MEKTLIREMLDFIDASPSCYHAAKQLAVRLESAGYCRLQEHTPWELVRGGKYYVVRGDSSVIAFRLPEGEYRGYMIAAGHVDSPCFKLREFPETAAPGGCLRLSAEAYGGGIWRTWLDRPLSVAGRVIVRMGKTMECRFVNIDRDLLVIPSVAVHMDREVNKGGALNVNVDMLPLFAGGQEPGAFRRLIAQEAGAAESEILASELFLYSRQKGTQIGAEEEFILSPRLDDLQCVFACLKGFLAAEVSGSVPVFCAFNHEEVGSSTYQGADSTFLTDVLQRISAAAGQSAQAHQTVLANSFLVSADNGHAVHPAHPEYADRVDAPVLNGGVVMKYNANQRYTTDAISAAVFCSVCERAGVPVQRYSNRADLPGGSTLGNISSAHLSIPAVDVGLAQLAMHSCCETAGARDTEYLVRAMTEYFGCSYQRLPDGSFSL